MLVLQPPSFCSTPGEDEARAAERRASIQQDMQEDEQRLAEQRWPFTGPRTTVKASQPPAAHPKRQGQQHGSSTGSAGRQSGSGWSDSASDGDGGSGSGSPMLQRPPRPISASRPVIKETAAALLRAQATKQAMLDGKYDTREERWVFCSYNPKRTRIAGSKQYLKHRRVLQCLTTRVVDCLACLPLPYHNQLA